MVQLTCSVWPWFKECLPLPKLLYFILNILVFSTYTFTAKYFEDVWGVPGYHYGYMLGLCAISFSGSLLWTLLADRTQRHKSILILTAIGYTGSFCLLKMELFKILSWGPRLAFVSLCYGISNFFTSALFPLLDNQVFLMLSVDSKSPCKELFGRQRLFGILGQSTITLLNGFCIGRWGFDSMFVNLTIACLIFCLLVAFGIPDRTDLTKLPDAPPPTIPQPEMVTFSQKVILLLRSQDYIIFLLVTLLAGITRGVTGNYLPQYLEKTMRMTTFEISVMLQSRLMTEVGIFFIGPFLLNRLGIHWLLTVSQITGLARVGLYAVIPSHPPWSSAPLVIELLKGVNSACFISAGALYAHNVSPTGIEATAQGFYSGVHSYLSNAASGFFGGIILQLHRDDPNTYKVLFLYTGLLSALGLLIYTFHFLVRSTTRKDPLSR